MRVNQIFWNAVITGVSLNDEETENTQGSRYCLVAIGRLQVFLEIKVLLDRKMCNTGNTAASS